MNTLKPCSYCGNTTFHYLPEITVDAGYVTTVLGMRARLNVPNAWWSFTVVTCTNCGNTLFFMTNAAELAPRIPGAKIIQAGAG